MSIKIREKHFTVYREGKTKMFNKENSKEEDINENRNHGLDFNKTVHM